MLQKLTAKKQTLKTKLFLNFLPKKQSFVKTHPTSFQTNKATALPKTQASTQSLKLISALSCILQNAKSTNISYSLWPKVKPFFNCYRYT